MITYIDKLKTTLHDLIHEMSSHYWLYVSDPKRNFSQGSNPVTRGHVRSSSTGI